MKCKLTFFADAISKWQNFITYIRRTPQHLAQNTTVLQNTYSGEPTVITIFGNLTRWSSDYKSLKRGLHIKAGISHCIATTIGAN